jgi:hypothetical protein
LKDKLKSTHPFIPSKEMLKLQSQSLTQAIPIPQQGIMTDKMAGLFILK